MAVARPRVVAAWRWRVGGEGGGGERPSAEGVQGGGEGAAAVRVC